MGRFRIAVDVCTDDDRPSHIEGITADDLEEIQAQMVSSAKVAIPARLSRVVKIEPAKINGIGYHGHFGNSSCSVCYSLGDDGLDFNTKSMFKKPQVDTTL